MCVCGGGGGGEGCVYGIDMWGVGVEVKNNNMYMNISSNGGSFRMYKNCYVDF